MDIDHFQKKDEREDHSLRSTKHKKHFRDMNHNQLECWKFAPSSAEINSSLRGHIVSNVCSRVNFPSLQCEMEYIKAYYFPEDYEVLSTATRALFSFHLYVGLYFRNFIRARFCNGEKN